MRDFLPALCLLLALAMLIAGFAVWSVEPPEAGIELHRARVAGDEDQSDVLEAQLERKQLARKILVGCLFAGSIVMTIAAFTSMRPSR